MNRSLLIGQGLALEQASSLANSIGMDCLRLELSTPDRYNFDLDPVFQNYPAAEFEVFVALDERAVNYARHKLIAQIRLAGYRLFNIVSANAAVDNGVRLMGNVYIGPGCNLASGSVVGPGCWLDRQVLLGYGARLGACVTLLAGVQIGRGTEIGKGTTLGEGSGTPPQSKVGHHCEWLLPETVPAELPACSFHDSLIPRGARILNGNSGLFK